MKIFQPEDVMTFGKCKGETLRDIYHFNPGYLEWLVKYTERFMIDVRSFKSLSIPTPYFAEKEIGNMKWWNERANTVEEAKLQLEKGVAIAQKSFQFSDETTQILTQKWEGTWLLLTSA